LRATPTQTGTSRPPKSRRSSVALSRAPVEQRDDARCHDVEPVEESGDEIAGPRRHDEAVPAGDVDEPGDQIHRARGIQHEAGCGSRIQVSRDDASLSESDSRRGRLR
jgi:hypothetical protein